METIRSPKRRFELKLHGTKSQKASIIDTTMKAFQRTVFFDHNVVVVGSVFPAVTR
jgi:hypothetical protein